MFYLIIVVSFQLRHFSSFLISEHANNFASGHCTKLCGKECKSNTSHCVVRSVKVIGLIELLYR